MDLQRTSSRADENLCIVTPLDRTSTLSPALRREFGIATESANVQVGVYGANRLLPTLTIHLEIHTPATLRTDWRRFLTPPLVPELRPPFSLQMVTSLDLAGPGCVALAQPSGADRFTFAALVNVPDMTRDTVLYAVEELLRQRFPALSDSHAVTWDSDLPTEDESRNRLLAERFWQGAYETASSDGFIAMRERYDYILARYVLPAERRINETRLVAPHPLFDALASERTATDMEERTLASVTGRHPGDAGVSSRLAELIMKELDEEMPSMGTAAAQTIGAEIARLRSVAHIFPDLPLDEAARWLRQHTSGPTDRGSLRAPTR